MLKQVTLYGMIIVLLSLCSAPAQAAESDDALRAFLVDVMHLDEEALANVAEGSVLVGVADVDSDYEVAVIGIARVDVPMNFFVERFIDLTGPRGQENIQQLGKLGESPTADDFSALQLPKDDISSLAKCKTGSCDVKLTEAALDRLNGDDGSDADAVIHDMLLKRSEEYLEGGLDALAPYVDKKDPPSVAWATGKLLGQSIVLFKYQKDFHDYVSSYPTGRLEGTREFLYWSLEDFGMKPTAYLTHVIVYEPPGDVATKLVIGEVGLYASHYFDGMLSIVVWAEGDLDGSGPANYVVATSRSWFDGKVTGLKRRQLNGRLKDSLKQTMESQRDLTEADYKDSN